MMTPKSRVLIVLIALLLGGIAVVFAYRLADGIFRARMAENYESKRIHVSSGKVLTVSATESEVPKAGQQRDRRVTRSAFLLTHSRIFQTT
jgi:hypothetical protein